MKTILWGLLFLAQSAIAQTCTSLVYVGAPFSTVTNTNPASTYEPFTINGPLTGTVTLSAPLPTNGTIQVTPLSWNFAEFQMSSTNFPTDFNPAPAPFSFTTVNGKITAWSLAVYWTNGDDWNLATVSIASSATGDTVDELGGEDEEIIGKSATAGTWTCLQAVSQPYTAPADPPAVNPLQAQVTALKSQLASVQHTLLLYEEAANSLTWRLQGDEQQLWAHGIKPLY
jgi:hypothetical protein